MSLSPVMGTEVPETANGVLSSSENGPHSAVKCTNPARNRPPCPEEDSQDEDRTKAQTDNNREKLVSNSDQSDDEQSDADTEDVNLRTAGLSLNSESDTSVTEARHAAPAWDLAHREGPEGSTDGAEGEKEKQDEEEDEKKWRNQHMMERADEVHSVL